ncbi:MAG: ATP-grasp domain-containing protein [Phycisphaerae bacterium]|nr:ATP-grasp domain-containing protein [Phycisphaerae bacterium]
MKTDFPPAFVTYGWCRTAYSVVRSLGKKGIEVHVGDASSMAMSRFSRYCKSFTLLPNFFREPQEYFDRLCAALKNTGAKVLLPCFEDVELVIKWRDKLPADVKVAVPDYEMWTIAEDKLKYIEHVARNGCPVPKTFCVSSREELEKKESEMSYPIVIKTRAGNSAKGVRIAKNREEFYRLFFGLVESYNLSRERWPIIQEYLSGQKVGVLGIYNKGKHVESIVFDIKRSKGASNFGTSTYRITIDDPVIKQHAIRVMESLNWHGVVDMDWVRDCNGKAHLIDINGRVGGAAALTVFSGMDMPYLWYLVTAGWEDIPHFVTYPGIKARWIIGDCLGFLDSLKQGKIKESLQFIKPQRRCYHDDFCLDDPLPFVFEAIDYFKKFVQSGGSTNPVTEGMIR